MSRSALRGSLSAAVAEARVRLTIASRYPGQLVLEIVLPVVLAAMPILLGRAASGSQAAANFAARTGTTSYVTYLLIGSIAFILVGRAFWDIANWLRYEQEVGTLEAISVAPAGTLTLAGGVALYSAVRGVMAGVLAYGVGCLFFGIAPLPGDVLLAVVFLVSGLPPLYATALLFGAAILRAKESTRLVNLMQWGGSFLMGAFYPVAALPPLARGLALLFPPTWMTNGVRASLLGTGFFFREAYADLAILWAFVLIGPLIGAQAFRAVERGIRRNRGLGEY